MNKPEPLFPPSANCPDCGKKIRIKWFSPRDIMPGLNGMGRLKCLHCGAHHVRAVGPADIIEETSHVIAAQYHQNCGHDHGQDHDDDHGHESESASEHDHDHMHGVKVIPGNETFAYIKLPG